MIEHGLGHLHGTIERADLHASDLVPGPILLLAVLTAIDSGKGNLAVGVHKARTALLCRVLGLADSAGRTEEMTVLTGALRQGER